MDLPHVSVVVPVYNAQQTISHAIQSLLSQSYGGDIEIIVVDDGSTDKTPQVVRSFREVLYVRQENAGPATARNRGAADSKGEFILFTDSDCIPHNNWVEKIVNGFGNENVSAVCGSYGIANPEDILARCIHDEILFRHRFLMSSYPRAFGSYNVGIRRTVFFEVGGFDESYRQASGEDNDLSYKVVKSGQLIYFERKAIVNHYHTTQLFKYFKEQYRHGFWRVKMYQDHPRMMKGDDYTFWKDIVEPPVVLLVLFDLIFFGIWFPSFFPAIIVPVFFLAGINFYYSWRMMKGFMGLSYAGVMFLRAFARTFGFLSGVFSFLSFRSSKKV